MEEIRRHWEEQSLYRFAGDMSGQSGGGTLEASILLQIILHDNAGHVFI
jgi:hypothetical protein